MEGFSKSFIPFLFNSTPFLTSHLSACCFVLLSSLSLHLCLLSLMKPLSSLSHTFFSSSLAVSRTQMRTLRCGLRYTGLASWPCSVHHTTTSTTRCTEPLKHPPISHFVPSLLLGLAAPASVDTLTITPHTRLTIHSRLNSFHRLLLQSCRCF